MDFKYKNSGSGVDRDYIFEHNKRISVKNRGDFLIKNTQVRELFLCNMASEQPQEAAFNTITQIVATKLHAIDVKEKIRKEIKKLKSFRATHLDDPDCKTKRQKQASVEGSEKHQTWSQNLSKNPFSSSSDECVSQTTPPGPSDFQKLVQKEIAKTKHARMLYNGSPAFNQNPQRTTKRSLTKKQGLTNLLERPVSGSYETNSPNPIQYQKPTKIDLPMPTKDTPDITKNHSPMSNSHGVLSPNQQRTTDPSLSKMQVQVDVKESHNAVTSTDKSPKQSIKKDVIGTKKSLQSMQSKTVPSPIPEKAAYQTISIVRTPPLSNTKGEILSAVKKSSQDKLHQQKEKLGRSKRIAGGCNCNNEQNDPNRPATSFGCQRCTPNNSNMTASATTPASPSSNNQQQPSFAKRISDLNTEEVIRGLSVRPMPNRVNTKDTVVEPTENGQPTTSAQRKCLNKQVPSKENAGELANAQLARAQLKEETPIDGPEKKNGPTNEQKRLYLEYMIKYQEELRKTANKSKSSKNSSDLEQHPTYTRLPNKELVQKTTTTATFIIRQHDDVKQDSSVPQAGSANGMSTLNKQQIERQEKMIDIRKLPQATKTYSAQHFVPESTTDNQSNEVTELCLCSTDKNERDNEQNLVLDKSGPKATQKPLMLGKNDLKEKCSCLPNENVKFEEDSLKTTQLGQTNLLKLEESSKTQLNQQPILTQAQSQPKNEPPTGSFGICIDSCCKLVQNIKLPTQQRPDDQTVSQEPKLQISRIPTFVKAPINNNPSEKRNWRASPVKLEPDQSTNFCESGGLQQAFTNLSHIKKPPAELTIPESKHSQNKLLSNDAALKKDQQSALQPMNQTEISDYFEQGTNPTAKVSDPSNSNNLSLGQDQRSRTCPCPSKFNTQTIPTKDRLDELNKPLHENTSQASASKLNTATSPTAQNLDNVDEPVPNDSSSDFSSQSCPAKRIEQYLTKLKSAQKEYELIMASNSNTLLPNLADNLPISSDHTEDNTADFSYDCQTDDSCKTFESPSKQQIICTPEFKEVKKQTQLEINPQQTQQIDRMELATGTHKTPSKSNVCQRSMRLVTFEDETGHRKKINTAVCHRNNIDWKHANEEIVVRRADRFPPQNDECDDENTFSETCISSSTADITCNESNCEDDYATCNESYTECEDSNEAPAFSGCPCMYDDFLKFTSLYVPKDVAKELAKQK